MTLSNNSNKSLVAPVLLFSAFFFAAPSHAAVPSLLFSPTNLSIGTDSQFTLSIILDTAGQGVSGAGAKIIFDPTYLTAISITTGDLFTDYPAAIINNDHGLAIISGIASSPTDRYTGSGTFAAITFRPFHPGQTKVSFNFTPNSTTDSNIAVMTGNGDILEQVNDLTVNITGDVVNRTINSPTPSPTISSRKTIKTIAKTLGISQTLEDSKRPGRETIIDPATDPLAPIKRQAPITDSSSAQPESPISSDKTLTRILIGLVLVLFTLLIGVIIFFSRRRHLETLPPFPTEQK